MASINWTKQALADLESVGDYIARDAPEIAQIFVNRILDAINLLETFPLSGRVVPEIGQNNIREVIFRSYRIVYIVNLDTINILTVFHGSRSIQVSALDLEKF